MNCKQKSTAASRADGMLFPALSPSLNVIGNLKVTLYLKQTFIILFSLLKFLTGSSQTVSERLILTDTKDSIFINASKSSFDKEGNYCFEVKQNDKEYFLTKEKQIGSFKYIGSTYGNGGEISYTYSYSDPKDKPWYYKNSRSTNVYGPVIGKLEKYMTSGTKKSIAIATSYADTVYYYVNGQLVSKNLKNNLNNFDIDHYEWCAFSENGNSIYYIKKDSLYQLFVNGNLIDKSVNNFNELHINNNGDYIYAEGRRPKVKTNGYDYMFFVHTKDTIIGPVRTVWDNDLTENNSYYFSGDDNGPNYIIINNTLQKGIEDVSNVVLLDKENYFYKFSQGGNQKLNVSGTIYNFSSSDIQLPSINKKGEFAFYGLKDYYLYKFINGKQVQNPITKYDVRPIPLYISPNGESLHYFVTDDSVYIYQDDKLLFKPISKKSAFVVQPHKEFFSSLFTRGKSENGNSLFYLEYESTGFWVFNGTFSKPMLPAKEGSYSDTKNKGEVVAGDFNDYGFFSIQKTGNKKYQINVNNKVYEELENIDTIIEDNYFYDDKELIFYVSKGLSIYQIKLTF